MISFFFDFSTWKCEPNCTSFYASKMIVLVVYGSRRIFFASTDQQWSSLSWREFEPSSENCQQSVLRVALHLLRSSTLRNELGACKLIFENSTQKCATVWELWASDWDPKTLTSRPTSNLIFRRCHAHCALIFIYFLLALFLLFFCTWRLRAFPTIHVVLMYGVYG